ncbi:hypothetical protein Misp04_56490 [Micromonospora sp. NBRC 101691]|nr:hypothetical protein Misp04_56490 [Micromonospora sp. NBRC 101691]
MTGTVLLLDVLLHEERGPDGGALGNHPQAFTHLALIEAALNLDAAGDRDHPVTPGRHPGRTATSRR